MEGAHVGVAAGGLEVLEAVDLQVPQVGLVEVVDPGLGRGDRTPRLIQGSPEGGDSPGVGGEVTGGQGGEFVGLVDGDRGHQEGERLGLRGGQ